VADLYSARRPFGYGSEMLSPGQVVELGGFLNDEKLIRLGYLEPVKGKVNPLPCRVCGAKFLDDGYRDRHGAKAHGPKPADPREEDAAIEREARLLNEVAPLYLDKTAEARGVKRGRRA
jgi:hypothetical protein